MRAAGLIAFNFLRQHRWPVILLFGWIMFSTLISDDFGRVRPASADVVFFAQQQAIFICVFTTFLAADVIQSERKSRRILLLLSKAISRAEYIFAVALATWGLAIAYAIVSVLCGIWLAARVMLPSGGLWGMFALVIAAALVSTTAAIFFATFLNPYLATACTFALFSVPAMAHIYRESWAAWLPGFPLLAQFVNFSFGPEWSPRWITVAAAVVQSGVFCALAAAVFKRRDIAVPVE